MNALDFIEISQPIQVMDVGASAIAEVPVYKTLLDQGLGHLNAFEGDERQIAEIRAAYGDRASIHNHFLFDGSEQTLYLASGPSGMTSLLKPDQRALAFFNGFPEFGHVESTETVQTRRMDDVAELPGIDFLKMDIQGAELTVLRNGTEKLRDCLAVQLEVSWICLYENQPGFGEVDVWMRAQGYLPHGMIYLKRWSIFPTIFNDNFRTPGNQLLESDIVYVRDPLRLEALTDEQLRKYALIAHHSLRSYDLCIHVIRALESRGVFEPDTYLRYMNALSAGG